MDNWRSYKYTRSGRILQILGLYLLLGAAVYSILSWTGQVQIQTEKDMSPLAASLIVLAIAGIGGTFAVYKGSWLVKRGRRFYRLMEVIHAEKDRSFTNLAAAFPANREQVVADLTALLRCGYLPGAYMDHKAGVLVLPEAPRKTLQTVCPHCGADLMLVEGEPAVCDYCGSNI